ncbi:conserved membrane hypothetical protein [[Clostridium] ultunense Esp]|nr:conserved membrane hypothetical protein [[Clostridium] ultunense Esp]
MNRKFWLILSHSFLTNVKSRAFILSTVIMGLIIVVIFNLPALIQLFKNNGEDRVGIVDSTGEVYPLLEQQVKDMNPGFTLLSYDEEGKAKEEVMNQKLKAYLLIERVENGTIVGTFNAKKVNDQEFYGKVSQALKQAQFRLTASHLGLTPDQAALLFQDVSLKQVALDPEAKTVEEMIQSGVLIYILLFALYFAVLSYGSMVAMEVAKEKSSRIMEILISSVPPVIQMFGKILGISLVGLFQFAIFILIGGLSMLFGDKKVDLGGLVVDFSTLPVDIVIYAVIYFVLGYLLYATLAAMLGSLVSSMEEIQTMIMPLTMVVVVAFMISMFGLTTPDAPYVVVSSYIPLFTPLVMFLRVGLSNPAWWEVLITTVLLIGSILLSAYVAAKVYRGGVLMYGKASFAGIMKAMKLYKEK